VTETDDWIRSAGFVTIAAAAVAGADSASADSSAQTVDVSHLTYATVAQQATKYTVFTTLDCQLYNQLNTCCLQHARHSGIT